MTVTAYRTFRLRAEMHLTTDHQQKYDLYDNYSPGYRGTETK